MPHSPSLFPSPPPPHQVKEKLATTKKLRPTGAAAGDDFASRVARQEVEDADRKRDK